MTKQEKQIIELRSVLDDYYRQYNNGVDTLSKNQLDYIEGIISGLNQAMCILKS